ncbi:aspartate/glutamate racemase family protein [Microbacterium keratanolyticum]
MSRILIVNPNTSTAMTQTIEAAVTGLPADAKIDVRNVPWGPLSVESETDNILAACAVLDTVWNARDDYDGFVIACFDDPGLDACRELVPQPVVGIGESAIMAAARQADRVGVIIVDTRVTDRVAAHCVRHGLTKDRLLFGSLGGTVLDLNQPSAEVAGRFTHVAQALIAQGAEALVLACAGFSDHAARLEALTGIPVLDGNLCGVERLQALLESGYRNDNALKPQPFLGARAELPAWTITVDGGERKDETR